MGRQRAEAQRQENKTVSAGGLWQRAAARPRGLTSSRVPQVPDQAPPSPSQEGPALAPRHPERAAQHPRGGTSGGCCAASGAGPAPELPKSLPLKGNLVSSSDTALRVLLLRPTVSPQVSELPFPFEKHQQFEQSIRTPVGPTWNTQRAFQKLTAPRVITRAGHIIQPLSAEDLASAPSGAKPVLETAPKQRGQPPRRPHKRAR